jgi:hypothetical protein
VQAVAERLVLEGRINIGEDVSVISSPRGFLLGLPGMGKQGLKDQAAAVWREGILTLSNLEAENLEPLVLLSLRSQGRNAEAGPGIFVGRLVRESLFAFPLPMKFILLGSFFLTVFLLVFLLFNLRQDSMTVIRSRLKRLQSGLLRQYYEHKGDMDWKRWARELEQRRAEVRAEIKRDLRRGRKNSPVQAELDTLIDLTWDELVASIGSRPAAEIDEEKLRAMIRDIVSDAGAPEAGDPEARDRKDGPAGTETAEELEEPEELEELAEADEPDELAESEDLEELDALEELDQAMETADEPEELTGLEPVEDEEMLEEMDEEKSPEGTLVTPAAFEPGPEAELEPLEEASEINPSETNPPETKPPEASAKSSEAKSPEAPAKPSEDLDAIASRIEFGLGEESGEGEDGGAMNLDMSSPFAALSFESPGFSGGDGGEEDRESGEQGKKKLPVEAGDDSGLEEITGDGGLPFIYQPFLFPGNAKPLALRPIADQGGEPIREQNGVHLINSEILDPSQENSGHLDPKFLHLVKSIIGNKD